MTPEQFAELAKAGFNRIPVYREVLADLDTPLSTYFKLASGPYSYLFESVQGGEKWGRYSIIGLPSREVLKVYDHTVTITREDKVIEETTVDDPLAFVEDYQARFNAPDLEELPRFNGGLVGYFGYDTVRYIEKRLRNTCPPDKIGTPDILLMVSDDVVVFDNLRGKLHLIVHADPNQEGAYEQALQRIDDLESRLHRQTANAPRTPEHLRGKTVDESDFISGFNQEKFEAAVGHIKEYVLDGDVMQTVISQRMSIPFEAPPLNLYRSLRVLNPSPYMYFLDLGDFQIVGSSPEILARVEDDEVTVRPIAGTRKRGATDAEDRAMESELLADPKEIAEHLMLIDLGRNDAGRVSETGTVKLTDKMIVERYSHVMHIVSNVTGRLKDNTSCLDVLRATLPAGTLSGAPKIRAMEIIDELEPVKRGVYGGAVGYLSFNGNMDTAIAIRTAVIKDNTLHIQAGAGVVADSVPRLEWKETMNKGRAIFRAVAMTYNDFDH
ncbi:MULTISPECIES: anthranilate synthase component I [Marinobacter]|jgi:anthranilate synthase component 1|uniref:anthranilate synthase component I n=1 Tax=Marinobacter TaxID=2742 RepID=UPI000C9173AD|nr:MULTISPECIES: anthranilate synthase component I [Marinobacter]MAB54023.1 anthranilate synthase component I [Marinobacter sp.]MDM8180540.1 anthranilate synthase component I [Marinobacter salarius]RUT75990.1 anthranilate synthase component I [Marinobacter sp. NP-6]|tara:strand:- start:19622 stop:21109 length:1488 start_codon:yes stop_codon:yes gene_type:complete